METSYTFKSDEFEKELWKKWFFDLAEQLKEIGYRIILEENSIIRLEKIK